jgi:hypothetical protein
MTDTSKKDRVLLYGRYFSEEDFWVVKETIRRFPKLSRLELVYTICENLEWFAPNGKYKIDACNKLIEKLEAEGQVRLPPKQNHGSKPPSQVIPGEHTEPEPDVCGSVADLSPVYLEPVRSKEDTRLWNEYVERYHYLGYKRPFGAHQRYFIRSHPLNQRLGCLLFSASAFALAERDAWIGWDQTARRQRLYLIVNNSRFLLFPWVRVKNLASKALSLAARRVPVDWQERYGFEPVLLETFVDTTRYLGTCYKAANWVLLGETAGRGREDRYKKRALTPKQIYVYPLHRDFRSMLGEKNGDAPQVPL